MDSNDIFSKENLLKYTPTNVIKLCFATAFITFCLVFIIMMAKAADIPLDKLFDAWIDKSVSVISDTDNHKLINERLDDLEAYSHEPIKVK